MRKPICFLLLMFALFLPATVSGQNPSPAPAAGVVSTLADAIERTLGTRPVVLATPHEKRAAEGRVHQAGRWPNPQFFTEWENFGGSGPLSGNGAMETTIGLTQQIPLGGKVKARRNLAKSGLQGVELAGRNKRLEIQALVVGRFVRVFFLQLFCRLEAENLALASATMEAVSKRVEAGDALPLEKTKAEVEMAAAKTGLERLRRELNGACAQLASLWGGRGEDIGALVLGDVERLPGIPQAEELWAKVAEHPATALARNRVAEARAELAVARTEGRPDLEITAGARRFRETGDRAYMGGLSISLPVFDRNQGEIRARRELVTVAELQNQEDQLAIREPLLATLQKLQGITESIGTSRKTILPGAEATYEATERGYRLGELGLLELLDAQRTLLSARRSDLELKREAYELFAELELWMPGIVGAR